MRLVSTVAMTLLLIGCTAADSLPTAIVEITEPGAVTLRQGAVVYVPWDEMFVTVAEIVDGRCSSLEDSSDCGSSDQVRTTLRLATTSGYSRQIVLNGVHGGNGNTFHGDRHFTAVLSTEISIDSIDDEQQISVYFAARD